MTNTNANKLTKYIYQSEERISIGQMKKKKIRMKFEVVAVTNLIRKEFQQSIPSLASTHTREEGPKLVRWFRNPSFILNITQNGSSYTYTNIYIDFDCFESVNVWSGSWVFFLAK